MLGRRQRCTAPVLSMIINETNGRYFLGLVGRLGIHQKIHKIIIICISVGVGFSFQLWRVYSRHIHKYTPCLRMRSEKFFITCTATISPLIFLLFIFILSWEFISSSPHWQSSNTFTWLQSSVAGCCLRWLLLVLPSLCLLSHIISLLQFKSCL